MNSGRCERRMDSGVTCTRGTRGCYVDHEAHGYGEDLMAIKGYMPRVGMVDMRGDHVTLLLRGFVHTDAPARMPVHEFVPDLKSGATRGLLLDQLREESGHADLSIVHHGQDSGEFHCALEIPTTSGRVVLFSVVGSSPMGAEILALIECARHYFWE